MMSNVLRKAQCGLRCLSRWPISHNHKVVYQSYRSFTSTPLCREEERKWSTPLAKQLTEAINTTGPIPLASYMRMCLTSDIGGYYTGAIGEGRDQFGQKGDFITSPEISQIFGELVGIWFVAEWLSQGRPKQGVELIELGPGRGTLMDDMLRTMRNFMASSIDTVYMVEASNELRVAQKNLLCGEDAVMTESEIGWQSTSKYSGLPIIWTDSIKAIPQNPNKMPFIVAHEFFDALPIHAFQVVEVPLNQQTTATSSNNNPSPASSTANETSLTHQWREMVVSPTPKGTTHADLRTPKSKQRDPVPEFQLTLSPSTTRHAQYLPSSSPRYRALSSTPGALIEVCPDASLYASAIATLIGGSNLPSPSPFPSRFQSLPPSFRKPSHSGAALIIDYGPADTIPTNSLRGIKAHRRVSPFLAPGLVDLSANVDFGALVEAAVRASPGVECHGPVEQARFLETMGVQQRAEMLAKRVVGTGKEARKKKAELERSWKRLVDRGPTGMGKVYKVLAILPENGGRRRPVGFGGDVSA
ncbi:DUF185-domain-containing protein [Hypoxylon crocopeplum]|nr:DUF185-domain-containing protein [Hypoxylon crocopeplum]